KTTSNRLSKTMKDRAAGAKRPDTSDGRPNSLKSPYINSPYVTASDVTLGYPDTDSANSNQKPNSPELPTVSMVDVRHHRNGSEVAVGSTAPFYDNNAERQD